MTKQMAPLLILGAIGLSQMTRHVREDRLGKDLVAKEIST
jgi:hypothetical protein